MVKSIVYLNNTIYTNIYGGMMRELSVNPIVICMNNCLRRVNVFAAIHRSKYSVFHKIGTPYVFLLKLLQMLVDFS